MFCYIICVFSALLYTSNLVRADSPESRESTGHLTIDLNALKNAAEVMRVLKAMNEEVEPESPQPREGYGKQDEGLQGIDIDYLGVNEARHQDIREILELLQKNKNAQEKHGQTKSDLSSRVYYFSNPEVLEKYMKKFKKGKERDSSASNDPGDSREKRIKDIWELVKTMRREGDVDDKGPSVKMIHPRLLHLNLEKHVPGIGTNIGDDEKDAEKEPNINYLRVVKDEKDGKNAKLTSSLDNTETTKMPLSSLENNRYFNEKAALRTTGYKSLERHDNTNDNKKKGISENSSEDDDKRITIIDFKAKDASKEGDTEDKSLENYKPPKKEKKMSIFDDANDDFTKKYKDTHRSSPKKKETTIDYNYSVNNYKKKRNRRERQENKWDKREDKYEEKTKREDKYEDRKREDRYEDRITFKTTRREPRKEERNYEMNRPRIKPEISKPTRNKISKLRNNKKGSNNFKGFGRTPVPIVGKRGIYEDD